MGLSHKYGTDGAVATPAMETSGTTSRWCSLLSPRGRHQSTARASLAPVQLPRGLSTAQGHWTHKRFIYSISLPAVHLHYFTSCTELQHKSGKHTMADVELVYKSTRSLEAKLPCCFTLMRHLAWTFNPNISLFSKLSKWHNLVTDAVSYRLQIGKGWRVNEDLFQHFCHT